MTFVNLNDTPVEVPMEARPLTDKELEELLANKAITTDEGDEEPTIH